MKLRELCTIQSGGTPSRSKPEFWENGSIPWVKISDFDGKYVSHTEEKITECGLLSSSAKVFPKGTLLYTIFATLGEVCILDIDAATNQAIAGITIKNDNVDEDYLFYFLTSLKTYVNRIGRGVAQNNINMSILREIEVPLPSIVRQKRIADILGKADQLIEKKERQLITLNELVKSRFVELFGDESNPYNFPIVTIEDVASVQVGVVIKPAQYYTDAGHGIKTFRSLNIGPMHIKDTDWVYFSEEGNRKNQKSVLNENDLVIVRSGAPGTACVITKEYAGCNAVDIIIARPDLDKVNPYYLCQYTNLPHGKKQIEEGTGGAAQQHFNVGKYNKIRLTLPPLDQQLKFEKFVEQTDKSKLAVKQSLEKLETLKKSLMQQYFG